MISKSQHRFCTLCEEPNACLGLQVNAPDDSLLGRLKKQMRTVKKEMTMARLFYGGHRIAIAGVSLSFKHHMNTAFSKTVACKDARVRKNVCVLAGSVVCAALDLHARPRNAPDDSLLGRLKKQMRTVKKEMTMARLFYGGHRIAIAGVSLSFKHHMNTAFSKSMSEYILIRLLDGRVQGRARQEERVRPGWLGRLRCNVLACKASCKRSH
ncbi:hypothetical protein GWK47_039474 [Chionoecetes opilio]|uniref:Uncharacterized protein n=1 Tax=Chionoecetes opilio TaxID=41210 RepID=A0A8J4YCU8_CHIOP|nr:hypothetical protein GWK47_039474 [Chionoecetes opilio]